MQTDKHQKTPTLTSKARSLLSMNLRVVACFEIILLIILLASCNMAGMLNSGHSSIAVNGITTGNASVDLNVVSSIHKKGKGSILANITAAITDPILVTVTGAIATVATATAVNLSASVPAGNTVTYVWYVNGASVGTGVTYTLNTATSPLSPGDYRVDCVALSADGQYGGDSTFFMNVTPVSD
jgi:hypothetical protein